MLKFTFHQAFNMFDDFLGIAALDPADVGADGTVTEGTFAHVTVGTFNDAGEATKIEVFSRDIFGNADDLLMTLRNFDQSLLDRLPENFSSDNKTLGERTGVEYQGSKGADLLSATDRNDKVIGGNGADRLVAADGNDTISGGKGNDDVLVYGGNDKISGGKGADTFRFVDGSGTKTIDGGGGKDTLQFDNLDVGIKLSLAKTGAQSVGDMKLKLSSIESVLGTGSDDQLVGSKKAETLNGFGGNDTLKGGGGADLLVGVSTSDGTTVMRGGAGSDTFKFFPQARAQQTMDVKDFKSGKDSIDLTEGEFAEVVTSRRDSGFDADQVVIQRKGGETKVLADFVDGEAELVILLGQAEAAVADILV